MSRLSLRATALAATVFRLERCSSFDHRIERDEHFSHYGDDGNHVAFSFLAQALVE